MGDSQHTQNIQINKVIGEHEKCVFYLMEKNPHTDFLANPILLNFTLKCMVSLRQQKGNDLRICVSLFLPRTYYSFENCLIVVCKVG